MIYFTSDTHYHHKNIVRGVSDWESSSKNRKTRDFPTLEDHDKALVEIINKIVKKDDTLYHLGDWSFGGIEQIWEFRKQLNCQDIHLIYGNHDHHIELNHQIRVPSEERGLLEKLGIPDPFEKRFHGFSHINCQDLFSSCDYYKELKINGLHIILSHYAMRVWNKSHRGSIMLYGHSHGSLDELRPEFTSPTWIGDDYFIKNYKTMDVGVDTNSLKPYSLTEIREIMQKKEILFNIDHHGEGIE